MGMGTSAGRTGADRSAEGGGGRLRQRSQNGLMELSSGNEVSASADAFAHREEVESGSYSRPWIGRVPVRVQKGAEAGCVREARLDWCNWGVGMA